MGWGEQQQPRTHLELVQFLETAISRQTEGRELARSLPPEQRPYAEGLADGMAEACRQVLRFLRHEETGPVDQR